MTRRRKSDLLFGATTAATLASGAAQLLLGHPPLYAAVWFLTAGIWALGWRADRRRFPALPEGRRGDAGPQ